MPRVQFGPAVESGKASPASAREPGRSAPVAVGQTRSQQIMLAPHLVLLERPGAVQLGIDGPDTVVLTDPDGRLRQLLELLDGRYGALGLRTAANRLGIDSPSLDGLLIALAAAGLLQSKAASAPRPEAELTTARIQLVGAGAVGLRLRTHLLAVGIGRTILVDPTDASTAGFDLTIAVSDQLEIDRDLTARLTRSNQPHLVIRPRFGGAVVGPLVVPGQSSCIRCADLTRTGADPGWPMLLAQLCRKPGSWDSLAMEWAAATAATQVIGKLSGRRVESLSATLELAQQPTGRPQPQHSVMQRRSWPINPACGCGWEPTAQW